MIQEAKYDSSIIEKTKQTDDIIARYEDLIGKHAVGLQREYSIESSEKLAEALQAMENEDRLLQIGIVGRVKAGKSSLLNALLFNGEAVLPKAATPMTAALTVLSYGESLVADVEFYSHADVQNIKDQHDTYCKERKKLSDAAFEDLKKRKPKDRGVNPDHAPSKTPEELREKADRIADRELKANGSLSASYDQYNKMKASSIDSEDLARTKSIEAKNMEDLASQLTDYVGSDGPYMPFTKSVHIKFPQGNLKDIQIVDTPGLNDPVQSREERTEELLKYCDVIFILSPAGSFLSQQDMELIDRITIKEGLRELYVIPSRVDEQLYDSEKSQYGGILPDVLEGITGKLGEQVIKIFQQLKRDVPSVGDTYDQLISAGHERILYSSGMCQTLKNHFNDRTVWKDGEKHTWGLLLEHYPDYFSDTDGELSITNLSLLANMGAIEKSIEVVRSKKDEILKEKKDNFLRAKTESFQKFLQELTRLVEEQSDNVKNGDIDDINAQKNELEKVAERGSQAVDAEYFDLVDALKINMAQHLKKSLREYTKEARGSARNAEGSETNSWTTGMWFWKEHHSEEIVTLRSGDIRSALIDLGTDVQSSIQTESDTVLLEWKKSTHSSIVRSVREAVGDSDLNVNLIRGAIRSVMNAIVTPNIKDDGVGTLSEALRSSKGMVSGYEAEELIEEAKVLITQFKKRTQNSIDAYVDTLASTLSTLTLSEKIFGDIREELVQLENQIKNKEMILDRYEHFRRELHEID